MSIDANRGLVTHRHAQWRAPSTYTDSTLGWYALHYEVTSPAWAFATDPSLERDAADLYRRARLGEPLGSIETPH